MYVIKETAHKLAAAGFPQPKKIGSGWYVPNDQDGSKEKYWKIPGAVYAPSILDLLAEMSGYCKLHHTELGWVATARHPDNCMVRVFYNGIPGEALAEAYLYINKPFSFE